MLDDGLRINTYVRGVFTAILKMAIEGGGTPIESLSDYIIKEIHFSQLNKMSCVFIDFAGPSVENNHAP